MTFFPSWRDYSVVSIRPNHPQQPSFPALCPLSTRHASLPAYYYACGEQAPNIESKDRECWRFCGRSFCPGGADDEDSSRPGCFPARRPSISLQYCICSVLSASSVVGPNTTSAAQRCATLDSPNTRQAPQAPAPRKRPRLKILSVQLCNNGGGGFAAPFHTFRHFHTEVVHGAPPPGPVTPSPTTIPRKIVCGGKNKQQRSPQKIKLEEKTLNTTLQASPPALLLALPLCLLPSLLSDTNSLPKMAPTLVCIQRGEGGPADRAGTVPHRAELTENRWADEIRSPFSSKTDSSILLSRGPSKPRPVRG